MTITEETKKTRRTYGRGFIDGLISAGVTDIEGHMNNAKLIEAERSQTGIAKKVMYAIPVTEHADRTKIMQVLTARGVSLNFRVLDGCLAKLLDSGLIKAKGKDEFIRIGLKPAIPKSEDEAPTPEAAPPKRTLVPANPVLSPEVAKVLQPSPPADPMDRLAELASRLRKLADEAKLLANEAEEVALVVEAKKIPDPEQLVKQFADFLRDQKPPAP